MKSKSLLSLISLVIITLVLITLFSIFHFPVYNTQSNNILHNIMNITPLPKLHHYDLLNGSKLLTVTRNGFTENVTLGFNGFYYYVNVSFTNLRNSSIIILTDEFFKPNTTIELFGSYPLNIEILNPLNDSAYSLLPTGVILGSPIIIPENYTFKPGQTMWFYKKIDYLCPIPNSTAFYNAFSRLSDLNPGNYELLVYSWLTNVIIKLNFTITTPLVPYLVSHNGKLYAILPREPSKIEVDNKLYSNIINVGNHIYEIGNWPNTSSGNCMELINAEIWFGNEVYNTSIYLLSYFPNEK